MPSESLPRIYTDFASWWPILSAPEEYLEEATFYTNTLLAAAQRPSRTLLELGSGGGNNASHMKKHFSDLVLVDRSPGMIEISKVLNPDCDHLVGDMRSVRLNRQFDYVFVHDAIVYMTTTADLRQAMETAFVHCAPGDRHIEGRFSRSEWLTLLRDVGFHPSVVPFDHSELEPGSAEVFVALRGK